MNEFLRGFYKLIGKVDDRPLVAVDIGSARIKIVSLDLRGPKPKLLAVASAETPPASFNNNTIVRPDAVAAVLKSLAESIELQGEQVVFSIPGPAAFIKKIQVAKSALKDFQENLQFEAGNYIPHSIDAVKLDFQVLPTGTKTQSDVLLVAVKNEVVDSFVSVIQQAGLVPVIADTDYFALENMFALNYPELMDKTVAIVNIGARYSGVNIIHGGISLITGDVALGGKVYNDTIAEALSIKPSEVEELKESWEKEGLNSEAIAETRDRTTEQIVSEIQRQLGFFWNASALEQSIDTVLVTGGSAQVPGLIEELGVKTGVNCELLSAVKNLEWAEDVDADYVKELSPVLGVSVGLGLRKLGDKILPA